MIRDVMQSPRGFKSDQMVGHLWNVGCFCNFVVRVEFVVGKQIPI